MSVQKTFNIIIANNLYGEEGSPYMCHAVRYAWRNGYITEEDRNAAVRAIRVYIYPEETLHCYLRRVGIPLPTDELMLEIYKNWEERWEIVERHKKSLS